MRKLILKLLGLRKYDDLVMSVLALHEKLDYVIKINNLNYSINSHYFDKCFRSGDEKSKIFDYDK